MIDGLKANTEYEVRAAAYVDVPKEKQSYSVTPVLTGNYSGVVTAVTGESSGQPSEGILRIYGDSRFLTSLAIADKLKENLGVSEFKAVVLATGMNFPDALCGGPLAIRSGYPLILANNPETARASAVEYAKAHSLASGMVFGSADVLTDDTVKAVTGSEVIDFKPY